MPAIALAFLLGSSLPALPACRGSQLRMGLAPRTGVADLRPVSGVVVSIRNLGRDCVMPALPLLELRDVGGRPLQATRRVPLGMHPGPVVLPIMLSGGHRATFEVTWPYRPTRERRLRVGSVTISFGTVSLCAPVGTSIGAAPAVPFEFDQPPGRVAEGMASDLE